MLFNKARVVPCNILFSLLSLGRTTVNSFPSTVICIFALNVRESSPLGPFTVTKLFSATITSTPEGNATGLLPIRDIYVTPPVFIYYQT